MLEFLDKNKEWIFSGAGITVLALLVLLGRKLVTASRPRGPIVRVRAAIIDMGMAGPMDALTITVQNPTEQALFLGNIFLELSNRQQFMPMRDCATGAGQQQRQLRPGDSVSFHVAAADIRSSGIPIDGFRCAAVRDALDRVHRSARRELQAVLEILFRGDSAGDRA